MKKLHLIIIALIILISIVGVFFLTGNSTSTGEGPSYNASALTNNLSVDMNNWQYDETNDIYYQIGLVYCMNPKDTAYESCGIYVPGKYFESSKNSNGTYSC
ncbi:MAG: hypothetical protein IKF79_08015, partial [Methanosphaera sp.]|nr:hypothetical protein [Methanosphaera sp.]